MIAEKLCFVAALSKVQFLAQSSMHQLVFANDCPTGLWQWGPTSLRQALTSKYVLTYVRVYVLSSTTTSLSITTTSWASSLPPPPPKVVAYYNWASLTSDATSLPLMRLRYSCLRQHHQSSIPDWGPLPDTARTPTGIWQFYIYT